DEDDEQFSITLSSLTNVDAGTLVGVGTITDNDAAPSLSISDASTAEGGKLSFTITLSAASEKTVTVTAASADGSATAADNDYTALASTIVTFAPGETSKVVEVQTSDDGKYEGNEDILLNLSLAANATIADAQGVGTITDEADKPSLSIADAVSVNEGGDLSFRVSLSNLATSPVTVFAKTADGSATSADNDYTSLGLTKLTIPALASFVDVVIHTTGDATFESDEDLFVQLSSPSSNASIAADKAKGIILNDDAKPKVSIDNQTIVEGGSLTFNVTLTNPSSQAISAAYS
ncbi:Calx-beta domain-containing protein, partial [Alistipes sp. ZOR0009]|uniref:Calx-beta domain-containing protein n=1 Tax=Alistipes sp. ZOR0009 TaxID=1339253 RepID=UPI0006472FF3